MKREKRNKVFSLMVLLVFALAHIPVASFHDHEHPPECILYTSDIDEGTETHFHESENDHCFSCAASFQKNLGIFLEHQNKTIFVDLRYNLSNDICSFIVVSLVDNSRAPPFQS